MRDDCYTYSNGPQYLNNNNNNNINNFYGA